MRQFMKSVSFVKCALVLATLLVAQQAGAQRSFDVDILAETFGYDEDTKHSVSLDDLHQGCRERDCIPSIDDPKYVASADASHVNDDELVLTLSFEGEYRAWPARILDQHEIVNDVIAGTPIAITWCPLCGSAVGVMRQIEGELTAFGVSGLLYNSDLVFYDRTTGTLFDQIEAKGIVGPLTGIELELVPVGITRWSRWKEAHPETLVLTTDTGFDFDYSKDHYAKYRDDDRIWFPVGATSDTIHPKTVVYGFHIRDQYVAYTEELIEKDGVVEHDIGGQSVIVTLGADGSAALTEVDSGEVHAPVRLFWFAWYTFHPETELLR